MNVVASKLLINGIVQGVGFRPSVYKVAQIMGLTGWVKNTALGVEVVLVPNCANEFMLKLKALLPKLASIDSVIEQEINLVTKPSEFKIIASSAGELNDTVMPADSAICSDCLAEVFDKQSKYYLYPFTNCTNCGPRYSVINELPYDRASTALANFPLCNNCQAEYSNPHNRRYHAQATACPVCGPKFSHDLIMLANTISKGGIVALKAVGGYVLICDARNHAAVETLRMRKKRPDKPFALMSLNAISIQHHFAHIADKEAALLQSLAAPIVLLKKRKRSKIAANVAPNLATFGFMLASNPLYYILFYHLLKPNSANWLAEAHDLALVVTSANFSGGTIISDDNEAACELAQIADLIVSHNRVISMKSDDSVLLCNQQHELFVRRARGFAPKPFYFAKTMPEVLALGAELKNTITYIRANKAFSSQYIGDMSSIHSIDYWQQILAHYQKIFGFKPELVVSDLHPNFFVSQYAENLPIRHVQLQHHFAHFASVLADANCCGKTIQTQVLGCILDGYGYGLDGGAWGCELIKFNTREFSFKVISHGTNITIPSGDLAEKEPWRLALAWCIEQDLVIPEHLMQAPTAIALSELISQQQFGSSRACGRKFSLIAALLNVVTYASYEAHAAMALEALVLNPEIEHHAAQLTADGSPDFDCLFRLVYQLAITKKNRQRAIDVFYGTLPVLIEKWVLYHCSLHNIRQVAISGGCWQSPYLLASLSHKLNNLGIDLLVPSLVSVNDECISFGQAWYGAELILREK